MVELYPLGAFESGGAYFEGDLKREPTPKLMLSGTYHYNNKAKKTQGQLGAYLYDKKDLRNIFFDMVFKYKGWSMMSSFMSRHTANALSYHPQDSSQFKYVYVGNGMDFQASYLTKQKFEYIARYSFINTQQQIAQWAPNTKQYTIGVTKYIWEHAFKLQTELTYEDLKYFDGRKTSNWYLRFQCEIGI
jgi:phosphate-selective porin OprO/OprP